MHAHKLRQLIGEFNHLLDAGEHDDVTLDEVRQNIEAGALASFLANRFPGIDVSLMEASDWPELNREWARFASAIDSAEIRCEQARALPAGGLRYGEPPAARTWVTSRLIGRTTTESKKPRLYGLGASSIPCAFGGGNQKQSASFMGWLYGESGTGIGPFLALTSRRRYRSLHSLLRQALPNFLRWWRRGIGCCCAMTTASHPAKATVRIKRMSHPVATPRGYPIAGYGDLQYGFLLMVNARSPRIMGSGISSNP